MGAWMLLEHANACQFSVQNGLLFRHLMSQLRQLRQLRQLLVRTVKRSMPG